METHGRTTLWKKRYLILNSADTDLNNLINNICIALLLRNIQYREYIMKYLCIYHGNCLDGFGAALAVKMWADENNIDMEFFPGVHGEPPPNVEDKLVFIVDFSYNLDIIEKMNKDAISIIIIDHHKSAAEELKNVPNDVHVHFDMTHSGAVLTWKYFFPQEPVPVLLEYIEDRDIWQFKLEHSQEVNLALFSYEYDFNIWKNFLNDVDILIKEGIPIYRKVLKDIYELVKDNVIMLNIDNQLVPTLNVPYMYASEVGNLLCEKHPFAATYYDTNTLRVFSLRSKKGVGVDVSNIAKKYGGGGHKHAAGFRIPISDIAQFYTK